MAAFLACVVLLTACSREERAAPACTARPVSPSGYRLTDSSEIERESHIAYRETYRGAGGRTVAFFLGLPTRAGRGLPQVGEVAIATGGVGKLLGDGERWVLSWTDIFPCEEMAVVGRGLEGEEFVQVLGSAQIIPFEEEEGQEGGAGGLEDALGLEEQEAAGGAPSAYSEWVAVFDAEASFDDLDPGTEELTRSARRGVAIGQVTCWEGLAQALEVPESFVVAAVVAEGRKQLEAEVRRVGRDPIFRGRLAAFCTD